MLGVNKFAVIGAGKLGETLIRGLLDAGAITPQQVVVTTRHPQRARQVAEALGTTAAASNAEAAAGAEVVLLSVKPQGMPEVLAEIGPALNPSQLVVSVAASVSIAFLEKHLPPSIPVVRAMPNTPCLIKQGMTGISGGNHAQPEQVEVAKKIFDAVGRTVIVDEKHLDAVTGLSASGPAFLCIVVESLAEAGVKVGLPRNVATELAAQTMLGTGAMVLDTEEHPAKLKDFVTTPAGCTIDGILELEDGGLRTTLIKAVVRATDRAKELLET